jgi:opacity protein-like surface antigen
MKKILFLAAIAAILSGCKNNADIEGTTWTGSQDGLKITVKFMKGGNYMTDTRGDFVNISGGKYAMSGDTVAFVALGRKNATYAIINDDSLFALENGQRGIKLIKQK